MPSEADDLDLEGELTAALDEQLTPEPSQEIDGQEKPAREYNRDEAGKFARKEAAPLDPAAAPATPAPVKPWSPLWLKQEHGIEWDKMPEPFRKALEQREREAAQAIEKHSTGAKAWEPLTKAIEPYAQQLQAANLTPQQYFAELHQWNVMLRGEKDPVKKVDALNALAESIGLDLVEVGQWLERNGSAPPPDPRDQRIAQLEQWKSQFETSAKERERAAAEAEIQAWAKDKPDFAVVRKLMAALATQNPQATLDELYDQARWSHPELRERILADQRKNEVKRARDQSLGTREQTYANGQLKSTPKLSIEEEIGGLIDGMI